MKNPVVDVTDIFICIVILFVSTLLLNRLGSLRKVLKNIAPSFARYIVLARIIDYSKMFSIILAEQTEN